MKNFLFPKIQNHLIFDKLLTGNVQKQAALTKKTKKSATAIRNFGAASPAMNYERDFAHAQIGP